MDYSSDDELQAALPIDSDDEASAYLLSVRAQSIGVRSGHVDLPHGYFEGEESEIAASEPLVSEEGRRLTLQEFEVLRQQTASISKSAAWTRDRWEKDLVELKRQPTLEMIGCMSQQHTYAFIEWLADLISVQGLDFYLSQVLYCALSVLEKPLLPSTAAELYRIARDIAKDRDELYVRVLLVIIADYFGQRLDW
jgi:hypothetical protein